MHLLVTDGAVLKAGEVQVVEGRRNNSAGPIRGFRAGQIGMAFETDLVHVIPRQHSGIQRTVWVMTGGATFEAHRSVLESEGPAFIAVAPETGGFVGIELAAQRGTDAAVRIVAVDATHRALRQTVVIGFLEGPPHVLMATGALIVDFDRLARHHPVGSVGMDLVTGDTRNRIPGVAALQVSNVFRLVEMTPEADLIGGSRSQLGRIPDESGVPRAGV